RCRSSTRATTKRPSHATGCGSCRTRSCATALTWPRTRCSCRATSTPAPASGAAPWSTPGPRSGAARRSARTCTWPAGPASASRDRGRRGGGARAGDRAGRLDRAEHAQLRPPRRRGEQRARARRLRRRARLAAVGGRTLRAVRRHHREAGRRENAPACRPQRAPARSRLNMPAKAPPLTLYGLASCDTCRAARKWLDDHDIRYRFHDLRADGLEVQMLERWSDRIEWRKLVNTRSITYRRLP